MTKATDLKTIFLKSPWIIHVKTCVTLWYLFRTKNNFFFRFFPFSHIFSPCLAPKLINCYRSNFFFFEMTMKKLGNEHAYQPYTYSLKSVSRGGVGTIDRFKHPKPLQWDDFNIREISLEQKYNLKKKLSNKRQEEGEIKIWN